MEHKTSNYYKLKKQTKMKRTDNFKKLITGAAVIATVAFLIPSCSQRTTDDAVYGDRKMEDPKNVAEETNEAVLDDRKAEKDAQFLVDAAAISLEEIQLGQLAQTKSMDAEVKRISQMMVADHTKSLNELKELASRKGIEIPTTLTEDGKDAYERLNSKKDKNFNEDYCDMMVSGHKKAINKYEEASKDAQDDEIRDWAIATLPKLRTHLDNADMCQARDKEVKKTAATFK